MKGQFFLIGFILIGLTVITLSFGTFESSQDQLNPTVKDDIKNSIPEAAESFAQHHRGRNFMEMMQYFSEKHQRSSRGEEISIIALAGFEEDNKLKLYLGNYRSSELNISSSVNSQNSSITVAPGDIVQVNYPISENYELFFESNAFSERTSLPGPSFFVVNYKYRSGSAVSQDTYIG